MGNLSSQEWSFLGEHPGIVAPVTGIALFSEISQVRIPMLVMHPLSSLHPFQFIPTGESVPMTAKERRET